MALGKFKTKEIRYSIVRKHGKTMRAIGFGSTIICIVASLLITYIIRAHQGNDDIATDIITQDAELTPNEKPIEDKKEETPSFLPQPIEASGSYEVNRVIDGDTIEIISENQLIKVRLIGVNTPETVHPSKPQECFGIEAKNYLKNKLSGQRVALEFDQSQDSIDVYGRLLAYVYNNGKMANYEIIFDGYGYEYTYNIPYKYQKEFKAAQNNASKNSKGLWSPTTCNGEI